DPLAAVTRSTPLTCPDSADRCFFSGSYGEAGTDRGQRPLSQRRMHTVQAAVAGVHLVAVRPRQKRVPAVALAERLTSGQRVNAPLPGTHDAARSRQRWQGPRPSPGVLSLSHDVARTG